MKKSQLRKLIRESINQLINEQSYGAYCKSPGCQCLPVDNANAQAWGLPYNWTGPGQHYSTYSDCLQDTSNCCADPDQMYSCNEFTGGSCSPDLTGNGQYASMADCEAAHPNGCESKRWDCLPISGHRKFGSECVEVGSATGKFYTKQECESSKGCAQLHNKSKKI